MKSEAMNFRTATLDSETLIDEASALLYLAYIEQEKWNFSPDNPSKIRIENKNGRNLLVDRFTDTSRWFGVFDNDKLIGCARLHGLDESGRYELEGYKNSIVVWKHLPRENCREMGKVAVHPCYKGKRVHNLIYLLAFEYCQSNKYTVFGGVSGQYVKNLFQKIKLYPKVKDAFKYEETDSYPVSFYYVDHHDFSTIIPNLRATIDQDNATVNTISTIAALDALSPILPIPTYWMDKSGHVLGVNDLCLKGMGLTREQVLGKNPKEFYPESIAEHILTHNEKVMCSEQMSEQEEIIKNETTGEQVFAKAIKTPLYDDCGNVIGIIGTSIDLTSERRAAQLEAENYKQQAKIEAQEQFLEYGRKLTHDLASPLTALSLMMKDITKLTSERMQTVQNSLDRIKSMINSYMTAYRTSERQVEDKQVISVSDEIDKLILEKKEQFKEMVFHTSGVFDSVPKNDFIHVQRIEFIRAISNLLNNAAEASMKSERLNPQVHTFIESRDKTIVVKISDSGNGMPDHVKEKILKGQRVTEGKENGNGMGMRQVTEMLNNNQGEIDIKSLPTGTTITLSFPLHEG